MVLIGKAIWGDTAAEENARRKAFSWLTRVGIGRRFGSLPIGWYQAHQVAACDTIERRAQDAIKLACPTWRVRMRKGRVEASPAGWHAPWADIGSVWGLFDAADRIARR